MSDPYDKTLPRKFNYMTLFMKYYIRTCKMQNKAIHLSTFVDRMLSKYRIEKFTLELIGKNTPPPMQNKRYIIVTM